MSLSPHRHGATACEAFVRVEWNETLALARSRFASISGRSLDRKRSFPQASWRAAMLVVRGRKHPR